MTVHVIDQGADAPSDAATGDLVLRRSGDQVEMGRLTDGGPEWLGSVDASTLPLDGDPADLETAARGVETALQQRGG